MPIRSHRLNSKSRKRKDRLGVQIAFIISFTCGMKRSKSFELDEVLVMDKHLHRSLLEMAKRSSISFILGSDQEFACLM